MVKSAPKQTSLDTSNFLPSLFILGFLLVGFVPNLEAVDKIAPQWLYLSILNLFCGLFLFMNRISFKERLLAVLTSYISLTYMGFVLWAALSYFYAINPTEVLVNIVRHFNTLFMFLHLGILLYNIKDKNRLLSLAIMAILSIEVYAVLEQAMEMYKAGGINPGDLKGLTANRNITAFSVAIKIPYVLYLVFRTPKLWIKTAYAFLILMSLFSLSMIQSRASFVAAALIGGYYCWLGLGSIILNPLNPGTFFKPILCIPINFCLDTEPNIDIGQRSRCLVSCCYHFCKHQ